MVYIYAYYRLYEIRSHFGSILLLTKSASMSSVKHSVHVGNSDDEPTDGPTLDFSIRKKKGGGPRPQNLAKLLIRPCRCKGGTGNCFKQFASDPRELSSLRNSFNSLEPWDRDMFLANALLPTRMSSALMQGLGGESTMHVGSDSSDCDARVNCNREVACRVGTDSDEESDMQDVDWECSETNQRMHVSSGSSDDQVNSESLDCKATP